MRVSVAVQHHPARAHLLPPLLARLPKGTEVVVDPDPWNELPGPLRSYTLALATTPDGASHRLVVQDDALPCQRFASRMLAAVRQRPDDLIAFFTPGCAPHDAAFKRALRECEPFARLQGGWYPTVAMCWPADLARDFAAWAQKDLGTKPSGEPFKGDDGPVGRWCGERKILPLATVPSLVEHPDVEPSLIGRPNRAGANRARVAVLFAEL